MFEKIERVITFSPMNYNVFFFFFFSNELPILLLDPMNYHFGPKTLLPSVKSVNSDS
jgi:hypothetical protein